MSWPSIVYNPGTGPVTLLVQHPMRFQCAGDYEAARHDNIASSGVRESILERIDTFQDFTMEWVGAGPEVNAWNAFVLYALGGGQFSYYPDSAQTGYTNYWLEDTNWKAAYKEAGAPYLSGGVWIPGSWFTFRMRWRLVVS